MKKILDRLENVRKNGSGWTARCPGHPDTENSLSIHHRGGKVLLKCFAGCSVPHICDCMGVKQGNLFDDKGREKEIVLTVAELATAKGIPESFLLSLGVQQYGKVVKIPYRDQNKKNARSRLRTSVTAKNGSRWQRGKGDIIPYGLWKLDPYKHLLVLVEGESDTWTLMLSGYPVLGIPGADMVKVLGITHLSSIREIYIVREPDRGGDTFVARLFSHLQEIGFVGQIAEVRMPDGCKDPNDLYRRNPQGFIVEFDKLLADAKEVTKEDIEKAQERQPLQWIDEKGKVNKGLAAEAFFREWGGNVLYTMESFWAYRNGYWQQASDIEVEQKIRIFLGSHRATRSILQDILHQVRLLAFPGPQFEFNPNKNLLSLEDCVLDIGTMQTISHSPAHYQNFQIRAKWHGKKDKPNWERYLDLLGLEESSIKRLQEWMGYCFTPHTKIQKALLLKGVGGDGKGTFIDTLCWLLEGCASSIEPYDLSDKFFLAGLNGKLVNVSADIEYKKPMGNLWKKVVSGDLVTAQYKFRNSFEFRPIAKHIYSTNDFPSTRDRSHGFFRRFDILEFKRSFTKEGSPWRGCRDVHLGEKLQKELNGIFHWAMDGLQRLVANNWEFTESQEFDQAKDCFEKESSPVRRFLEKMQSDGVFVDKEDILTDELRALYYGWCDTVRCTPFSEVNFGREVIALGWAKKRKVAGGKRSSFYSIPVEFREIPKDEEESPPWREAEVDPAGAIADEEVKPNSPEDVGFSPPPKPKERSSAGQVKAAKRESVVTPEMIRDAVEKSEAQETLFEEDVGYDHYEDEIRGKRKRGRGRDSP